MSKIPKSLIIGGVKWKILMIPKMSGGFFSWHDHTIKISRNHTEERRFQVLVHEIVEVIMVNNVMRFQKNFNQVANGDYLFSFNHDQFETATDEMAGVLKQFMRMR